MYIGHFVDLIHRNKTRPNIRFIPHSRKSQDGAPPNTCTLLAGAWLPTEQLDGTFGKVHQDHVGTYNVSIPDMPEFTEYHSTGHVMRRGWKGLIQMLLTDNVIRPTNEIVRLCGDDWDKIRIGANIRCY